MSKFRNWALRKLRGRTEEDYNDLYKVHCNDKLEISELRTKLRTMKIEPIRNEIQINNVAMMSISGDDLKEYVKNRFAEELGHFMVDEGFVSISSYPNGVDGVVYVMNTRAVRIDGGFSKERKTSPLRI